MEAGFRPISEARYRLGENLRWDDKFQHLWWTDVHDRRLWRFDPATGEYRDWLLPQPLGNFAFTTTPGILLVGLQHRLARFDTVKDELILLDEVEPEHENTMINDGGCDRHGNFVFGTIEESRKEPICHYYRFTPGGRLQRLDLPQAIVTNSICFSLDGGTMYFGDSPTRRIMACDYDGGSGEVANIRLFAATDDVPAGGPDGAIIDANGYLWSAQWGASRVVRYAPDGRIDLVVPLPVSRPTCPAFGGPNYESLYVTSAYFGLSEKARTVEPLAGAIFHGRLPRGRDLPESRYGLGV
nr:SMP-30/gluconolactonase/LRE family protein [Labrys sp. LIt4]